MFILKYKTVCRTFLKVLQSKYLIFYNTYHFIIKQIFDIIVSYNRIHASEKFTNIKRLFHNMKLVFCMGLWDNLQNEYTGLEANLSKYFLLGD